MATNSLTSHFPDQVLIKLDKLSALRFLFTTRYNLHPLCAQGLTIMPLDTSTTYPLTRLRLDGRRWNELRLLQAQISTNPASSGSSYLSMGNTAIMCSVHGPAEGRRGEASGAAGSSGAIVEVDVNVAGFASVDRKRKAGGSDRYGQSFNTRTLSRQGDGRPSNHARAYANPSIDNHRELQRPCARLSNRIYTPISTHTVQLVFMYLSFQPTGRCWRPPSMLALWL